MCDKTKILNPKTGRCVLRGGKIGKSLVKTDFSKKSGKKYSPRKMSSQKSATMFRVYGNDGPDDREETIAIFSSKKEAMAFMDTREFKEFTSYDKDDENAEYGIEKISLGVTEKWSKILEKEKKEWEKYDKKEKKEKKENVQSKTEKVLQKMEKITESDEKEQHFITDLNNMPLDVMDYVQKHGKGNKYIKIKDQGKRTSKLDVRASSHDQAMYRVWEWLTSSSPKMMKFFGEIVDSDGKDLYEENEEVTTKMIAKQFLTGSDIFT